MSVSLGQARNAIGHIESGNNYQARGPVVKTGRYAGERAMGRYQVMPGNLPQWSQQALGYQITPDQFMANSDYQDQIFDYHFGRNLSSRGFDDAASIWFSGQPLAKAQNRSDGYNTVTQYVNKANTALGYAVTDSGKTIERASRDFEAQRSANDTNAAIMAAGFATSDQIMGIGPKLTLARESFEDAGLDLYPADTLYASYGPIEPPQMVPPEQMEALPMDMPQPAQTQMDLASAIGLSLGEPVQATPVDTVTPQPTPNPSGGVSETTVRSGAAASSRGPVEDPNEQDPWNWKLALFEGLEGLGVGFGQMSRGQPVNLGQTFARQNQERQARFQQAQQRIQAARAGRAASAEGKDPDSIVKSAMAMAQRRGDTDMLPLLQDPYVAKRYLNESVDAMFASPDSAAQQRQSAAAFAQSQGADPLLVQGIATNDDLANEYIKNYFSPPEGNGDIDPQTAADIAASTGNYSEAQLAAIRSNPETAQKVLNDIAEGVQADPDLPVDLQMYGSQEARNQVIRNAEQTPGFVMDEETRKSVASDPASARLLDQRLKDFEPALTPEQMLSEIDARRQEVNQLQSIEGSPHADTATMSFNAATRAAQRGDQDTYTLHMEAADNAINKAIEQAIRRDQTDEERAIVQQEREAASNYIANMAKQYPELDLTPEADFAIYDPVAAMQRAQVKVDQHEGNIKLKEERKARADLDKTIDHVQSMYPGVATFGFDMARAALSDPDTSLAEIREQVSAAAQAADEELLRRSKTQGQANQAQFFANEAERFAFMGDTDTAAEYNELARMTRDGLFDEAMDFYAQMREDTRPTEQQMLEWFAGDGEQFIELSKELRGASAGVEVGPREQTQLNLWSEMLKTDLETLESLNKVDPKLAVIAMTVSDPAFKSGLVEQFAMPIRNIAEGLGIEIPILEPNDPLVLVDSIVNSMFQDFRVEGTGMQTEMDAIRTLKELASAGNTEDLNRVLTQIMQRRNDLKRSDIHARQEYFTQSLGPLMDQTAIDAHEERRAEQQGVNIAPFYDISNPPEGVSESEHVTELYNTGKLKVNDMVMVNKPGGGKEFIQMTEPLLQGLMED